MNPELYYLISNVLTVGEVCAAAVIVTYLIVKNRA